ncbi:hypothetical protein BASA62_003049 [Batrachochytrium salamandrivorans]|nr:hypothetical protein BASA62_003049 [Batrachochytrium salamandrivorans]
MLQIDMCRIMPTIALQLCCCSHDIVIPGSDQFDAKDCEPLFCILSKKPSACSGKGRYSLGFSKARAAEIRSRLVLQAPAYSEVIPNPHPIESINSPSSLAVSTLGESEREIAVCIPLFEEDASLTL